MTTPQTARCLALIAAAQARIAGMQAKNTERETLGLSLAYGENAFTYEANVLEQIALEVINQ